MEIFKDKNGAIVKLIFEPNFFQTKREHVLIICQYKGQWLLTKHKKRGLEFPGGKVVKGETLEEAARREVYEETGAILDEVNHIGEYEVCDGENCFTKAIFYGKVKELKEKEHFYETDGPVFVDDSILEKRFHDEYSFIMQDDVVKRSLEYIMQKMKK